MNEVTYDDVILNIKRIIKKRGIKQNFVASKAGFTSAEFSNIMNDRRKLLRVEHIPKIAMALNVNVDELFKSGSSGDHE